MRKANPGNEVGEKLSKNCVEWRNSVHKYQGKINHMSKLVETMFTILKCENCGRVWSIFRSNVNSGFMFDELLKTRLKIFFCFFQKTLFSKFKQLNSGCSLFAGVYGTWQRKPLRGISGFFAKKSIFSPGFYFFVDFTAKHNNGRQFSRQTNRPVVQNLTEVDLSWLIENRTDFFPVEGKFSIRFCWTITFLHD